MHFQPKRAEKLSVFDSMVLHDAQEVLALEDTAKPIPHPGSNAKKNILPIMDGNADSKQGSKASTSSKSTTGKKKRPLKRHNSSIIV